MATMMEFILREKDRLREIADSEQTDNLFVRADHTSDVVFVVQEQKIHFNKAVLSMCSPVFDRMFHGDFVEKGSREIPLPGKKYSEMLVFLKLIHPAYAHTAVTDDNLLSLLRLSREYQVESIRTRCEQYIAAETERGLYKRLRADRILLFLYACDQHDLKKPLSTLKSFASRTKSTVFKASSNFQLAATPSFVEALLTRCAGTETIVEKVKKVVEMSYHWFPGDNLGGDRDIYSKVRLLLKEIRVIEEDVDELSRLSRK